jgi:molybdenum cofactor biosynthesis enzyme MoaA
LGQKAHDDAKTPKATLNDFGYQVSEVCTLKCVHCHEAVPYLSSKVRLPKETIVRDIKTLSEACQFLHRLDFVGGEPFAHAELAEIIREVTALPKIGYIALFTNGTSIPSDKLCEALRNDRIIVTVSDYRQDNNLTEAQAAKIDLTIERLKAHNVNYIVIPDRYWFDMNGFEKGDLSDEKLEKNFAQCFMAACHRVYDGTLYHCPYQAAGVKLGKFEKRDCVEIHKHTPEALVEELNKFDRAKMTEACRYCNLPKGPKEVIAGKQLDRRPARES